MADLYNLMEELDEAQDREDYDDKAKEQQGRPSLAVTEATEPMSSPESHVGASFRRDDSGEDDIEGEEWDTTGQEKLDVPLALQQAEKQRFDTDIDQGDKDLEDLQDELIENDLYKRLQRCWMQERRCPELLPYDETAIEEIQEKMEEQQDMVDQLESTGDPVEALMSTLGQMDLDRTKFALSDWLTCRLSKIEAHPIHMRDMVDHMSDAEIEYLKHYGALMEHHLRQTVLDHIPDAWQDLAEDGMVDLPNEDGYYFWKVKEKLYVNDEEEEQYQSTDNLQHDVGTCLVAKYKDMKQRFKEGKVEIQF